MEEYQLDRSRLTGIICKAKKIDVGDKSFTSTYSAPRGESFVVLVLGTNKKGYRDPDKQEGLGILGGIGFVQWDELIPHLGKEKVLELVKMVDKNREE